MKLFDLSPAGYTHDYALQLLEALGPSGRKRYLYRQLPLDFLYPALFAAASSLSLAWVFRKGGITARFMYYLCLVPVLAAVLDYLENIQIILMLTGYPDISGNQVSVASLTTIGKSGLTTLFFILLLAGFVRLAFYRWRE